MHCIQYAVVGDGFDPIVYNTENLTDEQVRDKIRNNPLVYGELPIPATIIRFNRCPECEEWTTEGGKLRRGMKCPAVKQSSVRRYLASKETKPCSTEPENNY